MNYELAQKLKDAGFPQKEHRNSFCGNSACGPENRLCAYDPTLSELIEACGDGFGFLIRLGDRKYAAYQPPTPTTDMNAWLKGETVASAGMGETPEEAVAYLWLGLNNG